MKNFYLIDNIFKKGSDTEGLTGTIKYKVYSVLELNIKIGFLGISSVETLAIHTGDTSYINLSVKFKTIIEELSKKLREEEKVDAVVLLSHIGFHCENRGDIKQDNIGLFNEDNGGNRQDKVEQKNIIESLNSSAIDLVLGNHFHLNIHYFLNRIPVVLSINNFCYFNITYLYFKKDTKKLDREKTLLEGLVPICSQVYSKYKRCRDFSDTENADKGSLTHFKFHQKKIVKDGK